MSKAKNITLLDGAMGTRLMAAGMPLGARPEVFGMKNPDIISGIHRQYIDAGSDVIYTNTFGANARKLKDTGFKAAEVIKANVDTAVRTAKEASGAVKVALDIGPIGEMMAPLGSLEFDEAYDIFTEMVIAGEEAGADLVIFETFSDLYEVKAGVLAALENTQLPIWVTMSFEADGRTFTGTTVEAMAVMLDALPVEAMGINCSLGPDEIYPLIKRMSEWTDKPLIAKPNAGLPDPLTGEYGIKACDFGPLLGKYVDLGVSVLGGCCGTAPEYIRSIADMLETKAAGENAPEEGRKIRRGVASYGPVAEFGKTLVIGERINPTGKKKLQAALSSRDYGYIMNLAIEQQEAGADILDINVGIPGIDEVQVMGEVVRAVQGVCGLPLMIDSTDPDVIEAGLRAVNGRAIVNSVNADEEVLANILPIVKHYGAAVVGLTMSKSGLPANAEERIGYAEKILSEALKMGIDRDDVLIDCLTLTISAQPEQVDETLRAMNHIHSKLQLHCLLGVSNISFGLPQRLNVTSSFLNIALYNGLDMPIVNPCQKEIMDTIASFRALSGEDKNCAAYIERFAADKEATAVKPDAPSGMDIEAAVLKGLKDETARITRELLKEKSEEDVINTKLIPALDVVGRKYEKNEFFLPQLINSANAACAGFDVVKEQIASRGQSETARGTIVLATVEGDIHDIGKNIVKVVLENYGYRIIDLGKDVPPEKVVAAVKEKDAGMVGLSALMTTTVSSMERTIAALRAAEEGGRHIPIMVGGAVLTAEHAARIGADHYAKDAMAAVNAANTVFEK